MIFRDKTATLCKNVTFDPLNYKMDHDSKIITSIQKEEFIGAFKGSAEYYILQQSLNYMYTMKHQIL